MTALAMPRIARVLERSLAPRVPLTVSQWADKERRLSSKGSAEPGPWRTDRNPPLREPMDCLSKHSQVHDVVLRLPIQFGKTEVEINTLGYTMDHDPGPIMVVLPDDISMAAWIAQKFNPMIEETPAVQRALTTSNSRDSANQRAFKDFLGGQIFIEHGKTATRLALKSARVVLVDELDKFIASLVGGEDPVELLKGRTSAFPSTYKRCFIGSPGIKGISRLDGLYEESDQRKYYVPCPHCQHEQPFDWAGLHWSSDASQCWYVCRACLYEIQEHHKTEMIRNGRWVAENPGAKTRGYHLNCLYYQIGLGPRWIDLVHMWRAAQKDPAKLQVFVCERLAESWEDPSMRRVKHDVIRDRAEAYRLRVAPLGVLAITAGVDTQDDRLEVQIVGWGRGKQCWTLDYHRIPGDPADDATWVKLVDFLNRPIEHINGGMLHIEATAIDAGGHRTEAVKAFVRARQIRRPLCIFGAVPNNAPVLSKGKLQDINWRGQHDKRGVTIHHVGTVAIKHLLYSLIGADADLKKVDGRDVPKEPADRYVHLSDELDPEFFTGFVGETYDPSKNRFVKRSGMRNEPLDTWVYAYAATHHPELRLHRRTNAEWDAVEARLQSPIAHPLTAPPLPTLARPPMQPMASPDASESSNAFGSSAWSSRL